MNQGAAAALSISVVLTAILPHIPYARFISLPLLWFSTLAHECGHGVTALLVGGSWRSLAMHSDASGVAVTAVSSRLGSAAVAAGGLVGPAVAAAVCFFLSRSPKGARVALGVTAALLVLLLLTKAGNLFGFVYLSACALLFGLMARYLHDEASRMAVSFLGVQLAASVFSRSDYLFVRKVNIAGNSMSSDVEHIAEALWLPYWFWGAACGAFSLAVLAVGVWGALTPTLGED